MADQSDTPQLMSIGEFSSRSRLSVRMLRHYDEHGVLTPAVVDTVSGYRRYRPEQLARAAAVRRLRDVGFPVAAIPAVLAARGTDAYLHAITAQRRELVGQLHAAQDRLALIDRIIDQEGTLMSSISVATQRIPARTVVTLRGTIPSYADEGQLWGQFLPELTAQGITPIGPGGCIEHDPDYRESDVDESVWLPVAAGTRAVAPLQVLALPEQDVVVARVTGPYSLISAAHERIEEFVRTEGLRVASRDGDAPVHHQVFNRYLADPSTTPPEALLTEICVPLA